MASLKSTDTRAYKYAWGSPGLRIIAISSIATALSFYQPVGALYLQFRGLSFVQIFTLESIMLVTIFLSELPTGALGDRLDRRIVLILGLAAGSASQVLYALGSNYFVFVTGSVVAGFGIALLSGTKDAYIYGFLSDQTPAVKSGVFGHLASLSLVAGLFATLTGSWLASFDLRYPVYLTALLSVIGTCVAIFLPSQPSVSVDVDLRLMATVKRMWHLIVSGPNRFIFIFFAVTPTFGIFNSASTLNQPIFVAAGLPIGGIGVVVAVAAGVAAIATHFLEPLERTFGRRALHALTLFFGAAGFGMMFTGLLVPSVIGFIFIVVGMNVRLPLSSAILNSVVPDSDRATALSAISLVGSFVGIGLNPLVGVVADKSAQTAALVPGSILLVAGVLWFCIYRNVKTNDASSDN